MILINIPIVREAFGITPIDTFEVWLIIAMCLITFFSVELTKAILNKAEKRKAKLVQKKLKMSVLNLKHKLKKLCKKLKSRNIT